MNSCVGITIANSLSGCCQNYTAVSYTTELTHQVDISGYWIVLFLKNEFEMRQAQI